MAGEGGGARRAVPPLDLRPSSLRLHHLTGPARVEPATGCDDDPLTVDLRAPGDHREEPDTPRRTPHLTSARTDPFDEVPHDVRELPEADADVLRVLGARDVLVLRRIGQTRWTHLGGRGRGESWAGVVDVDSATDERLARALRSDRPVRQHGVDAHHVLGPYWAMTSALIRIDEDHAVVLGAPLGSQRLQDAPDDVVVEAARRLSTGVLAVSPTKHLADEVEIMSAVREFTRHAPTPMDELMRHVAGFIAQSLSCELAALWLEPGRFAVVQRGWSMPGSADELAGVMAALSGEGGGTLVVQDAAERPLTHPVGAAAGVVSYLLHHVEVEGRVGLLLVAHAEPAPRGFTALCQRLLLRLAETATLLLGNALVREELERALHSSRQHARRDALTATANRRGWDEALQRLRPEVASGVPVTVVAVDLDGLKEVNDSLGHHRGDELIVACARALQHVVRERDVVARLGGDEFGLLMPGVQTAPMLIARRLRRSLDAVVTPGGVSLRTSIGAATCPPYGRLEDAWAEADAAMYDDKRARRRSR
ncbi:MAG TPA: GGDEF domain-containing protein [Actinomycetales bacterium]|nr:GGDEF domain-containing protein [Actinomycetales bacterium]